ncbi:MAG: serine/threonine-protein kinase [Mariprofundus sp.]|nr:serine/threonine-protein kinase [Mariprofundus sp.]
MNFSNILKSNWLSAVMLTLLFLFAYETAFFPLRYIENLIYDQVSTRSELTADKSIILIEMDEKMLSDEGQQPGQAMASVIDQLSEAGARVIGLDALYSQPVSTTTNQQLVDAVRHSGNTLMPMFMDIGSGHDHPNAMLPNDLRRLFIKHVNITDINASPLQAVSLRFAYAQLLQASAGIGSVSLFGDDDGVVRSEPLAVSYAGKYFPSMSLALAAKFLNIPLNDIRINLGMDIEIGAHNIATDARLRMYPIFSTAPAGRGFASYAFDDVLSGRVNTDNFRDKIILIGSAEKSVATPARMMTHNEFTAHALQSLLHDQYISRPAWTHLLELALLILIGLYLILLLPRLSRIIAAIVSGLMLLALISTGFIMLSTYALWIQTLAAALLLLVGHVLLALKQVYFNQGRQKKSTNSLNETNKMMGFSFQSQGMLEQALEKFLACPVDDEIDAVFYDLALAFERKRQYEQAVACFEHIISHNPAYQDVQKRLIQAKHAQQAQTGKDSNAALSALLGSGESNPTLGRYEIISELGKGAMGTVYLGMDPKINRQVAIKTMALSQEFEPEELEEVKTKFFHEAEIAGMLNHPNIVTIFDAGDEHDLAYIAMEFLDGIDLVSYTKKGKLLPVSTVLKVVAKVAEALQYAHANGVIHRDIKPANIMILKNKSVKVTDFGIAHIIEPNKKKAGTVLGTPSYMSPEQLSGKELDGRSDLFSLGVMLYELVSGIRPFRGESISKLMFKIAKEPHVDVRQHNADVPDCVCTLIDSLLTKKADFRIENASEVMERISACLRELKGQRGEPL